MAVTGGNFHFSKGPATKRRAAGKKANDAGHAFQVSIAKYLKYALPPEYIWTASAMGVYLPLPTAVALKEIGGHRGWGDYQILFPSAVTRYGEAKWGTARLTDDQEKFRDFCLATGRDIWAEWRSLADVEASLIRWKVPVRCSIGNANRYAIGGDQRG